MRPALRGIVIVSSVAYGDGGGAIPGTAARVSPRDDAGNLIMLGSGQQHWSTVQRCPIAMSSAARWRTTPLTATTSSGTHLNPTVAELTDAAAVAVGAPWSGPRS